MSGPGARRGRPPSFDRDGALQAATRLFWERGYEATSIGELTAAMGIRPGSLYAAFGDKKTLFKEVVRAYGRTPAGAFVYIPADVPHLPYNPSETEEVVAIISRTDPNEQESVVLLPELDKVHP